MGFTVRFMLGMVLVLLSSWSIQTTNLNRQIREVTSNGDNKTTDKLQKIESEITTQHTVTNLSEENKKKPKTDTSTEDKTIDKQNSVVDKLQEPESSTKLLSTREEIGRSIDIEKYVSKEFHSKNNVYTLPISPDTEKYIDPEYDFHHASTHKHGDHFHFDTELTTPKSSIFDHRFKEAVESVDQKLEHIDDSHEISAESEENINLEKLYNETLKNDTKADLDYISYKNIVANDTGSKNTLHKDVVLEAGTNLNFRSTFNHTTLIDEDDEKKPETSTLSNVIPVQGDLEKAESSTSKNVVLTTRKSLTLTKPPSNRNSSHNYILNNTIETETIKAINPFHTTESSTKQKEVVVELPQKETPVDVSKRLSVLVEPTPPIPNEINKTSEQLLQENQVIPIHTIPVKTTRAEEPPTTEGNVITVTPISVTTDATTDSESTTHTTQIPDETTHFAQNEQETTVYTTEALSTETLTSIVTETSTTPWERMTTETVEIVEAETMPLAGMETTTVKPETLTTSETVVEEQATTVTTLEQKTTTVQPETLTTLKTVVVEQETTVKPETLTTLEAVVVEQETTFPSTIQADSTAASTETTTDLTEITTSSKMRTSKGLIFNETTTTEIATTTVTELQRSTEALVRTTTEEVTESTTNYETTEPETAATSMFYIVSSRPNLPKKLPEQTPEIENTTDNNNVTSDYYEHPDSPDDNSGTIAAITISSIGAVCLILLAGLLVIMRKRQKRFNYGQRCRPVSLDDYSMDNVSVYNSVRRKGMVRGSKRSYGNPAFEDPVSVSHPLNFPALGKFSNNLEDIRAEFEDIPQITARTNELPEGCDTKNRYANVIPLPETRVFLNLIDGYPNSDYINANYVTGPKNTKGYYIACQAPMQNTVDDFWRMIWEQQCKVVLMLTHLFENGVEKCVDYLPPSEVLDCHRLFGDFQVTLKKREVKDKYIISSLQLKNMVSNSWREVTHFWYLGWPEKGIPTEANSLIAFLIEARSYMKSASLDRKDVTNGSLTNGMARNEVNPVVVHCSPGTGRTGVVIACDIAIREFEQTRLVDVPRIVYKIRRDRASAVQTKEQYAFIYKVINLYATKLTGGALDSL